MAAHFSWKELLPHATLSFLSTHELLMDLAELQRLVAAGESETVEFKKTTADLSGACESLCAFLNGIDPGTVVIGAANGKVIGQEVSDHTQQEIANALSHIDPRIKINLTLVPVEQNRKAIVLQAQPQPDLAPHSFKGRPYWRIGTTTSVMPRDHYDRMVKDSIFKKDPYDQWVAREYSTEYLNFQTIEHVLTRGIQLNRLPKEARGEPKEVLTKLEILVDGKPTNAAAILFGTRFFSYPQCRLHIARFKGTRKGEFLDHRLIRGNAFEIFDEGMLFMQRHIPLWGKIESGNPIRQDGHLIPLDAFREALVNAICHRDYSDPLGRLTIAIYDDRMEIENEGSLLHGMKLEDLKKSHLSNLRNPLIAEMFYCYGLIEQWGQGTQKIVELCKQAKLPEPEYSMEFGCFRITFRADIGARAIADAEMKPFQLRRQKIYELLARKRKLTFKQIHSVLSDVPLRTLQDDLVALKKEAFVTTQGTGAGSFWVVSRKKAKL